MPDTALVTSTPTDPGAGTERWADLVETALRSARAAADPAELDDPAAGEACAEATVALLALRAVGRVEHDPVIAALVERRAAEIALGSVAELLLAVASWPGAELAYPSRDALAHIAEHDVVASVAAALTGARLPEHRPDDLHAAVAERAARLLDGVPGEWGGDADVRRAGLPVLGRSVSDVVIAVAMGPDPACSDVGLRRFTYRRFGEGVPEGLTARHLHRSRELVHAALADR